MNRRGFLGAILATGCAPAICRAEWLMKGRVLVTDTPAWLRGLPMNEWSVIDPSFFAYDWDTNSWYYRVSPYVD